MMSGIEKPAWGDVKGVGEPLHHQDGRIARTALEVTDVGPMEPDFERERLLRQPALGSERAQVAGEAMADVHEPTLGAMSSFSLQTISDIQLDLRRYSSTRHVTDSMQDMCL